jgi:hypothetical protein
MWVRLGACVCVMAVAIAGATSASAGGHRGIAASVPRAAGALGCTTAAASQAATAAGFGVDPISKRTPINSVVCGPFFGADSQGMAATVAIPTGCGFSIGWGVFRAVGGTWQLVMKQNNGARLASVPLPGGGADIRTTQGYPQRGEVPECATGPSRIRSQDWHWNGTSFVSGSYVVTLLRAEFDAPRGLATRCWLGDNTGWANVRYVEAVCQSAVSKPRLFQKATLKGSGVVKVCRTHKSSACNIWCGCEEGPVPTLNYGQHIDVGRFRCEVLRSGVRCTIVQTGKGFLLGRRQVVRLG